MKIHCDTCSAKYSVPDHKVAGRAFKIRCKKCGGAIVVRGDRTPEGVWHVSSDGESLGPFTVAELAARVQEGTVNDESFVWREGLDDWKAAREVDALAGLFAAAAPLAAATTEDLFAGSGEEDSPFAATAIGPAPTPSALTGTRNENSVLFSLSNLQDLSHTPSTSPTVATPSSTPSNRSGHASGEGSGLIDIRALAGAIGASPPAANEERVDDLLCMGGALGSPLGAPVVVPEPAHSASKTPILIGAAVATLAAAAAALTVMMVQLGGGETVAAREDTTLVDPGPAVTPPHETSAPTPGANVVAPVPGPSVAIGETPAPSTEPIEPAPDSEPPAARRTRRRTPRAERPTEHAPGRQTRRVDPDRDEAPSINEILGPPRRAERTERRALPETPSRPAVMAAMSGANARVRACADGNHGRAVATLTFAGDTGRVRNVTVNGSLPAPVRSCVARAVRGIRLARFERSTFNVTYPYAL